MQRSITNPNPPFPENMALILFRKLIERLCRSVGKKTGNDLAKEVEEKINHLKTMRDKNILTEDQYSAAIEKLLENYTKLYPEKVTKNTLNEFEKHIM